MNDVFSERQKMLEVYQEKQHPQQALLDPWGFERFLGERNLRPSYNALETWDKLGAFHPIHRVRFDLLPEVTQRLVDDNGGQIEAQLECPSADNYRIWSSLKFKHTSGILFPNPSGVSYHPYQIFRLHELYDACSKSVLFVDFSCKPASMKRWQKHFQTELENALVRLRKTEAQYLHETTLLLLIEDRYLPKISGVVSGIKTSTLDEYYAWVKTFDAGDVLKRSGFDAGEVKEMRTQYAWKGWYLDPNEDWYVLIRHIKNERRKELKGEARLAWDYYNVAEMLGLFLTELTGEKQPQTDDLMYPRAGWKRQLFGVAADDFDYDVGNALPGILRYYELDPRIKVLAIFEGDSELAFVEAWLTKHEIFFDSKDTTRYLREEGVVIVSLRGYSGMSNETTKALARLAKEQGACVFAIIDADMEKETHTKQLNQWQKEGLIGNIFESNQLYDSTKLPIGGMLWEPCFEEANFTREEVMTAWLNYVAKDKRNLLVDVQALTNAITKAKAEKPSQTWIDCIEQVRIERRLPFAKVGIAKELAEAHWNADKPIVRLLNNILTVAYRARSMRYDPRVTS